MGDLRRNLARLLQEHGKKGIMIHSRKRNGSQIWKYRTKNNIVFCMGNTLQEAIENMQTYKGNLTEIDRYMKGESRK